MKAAPLLNAIRELYRGMLTAQAYEDEETENKYAGAIRAVEDSFKVELISKNGKLELVNRTDPDACVEEPRI